jgi:hypothetical protein
MPRAGFEPATPGTKRPHTYILDRVVTGISIPIYYIQGKRLFTSVNLLQRDILNYWKLLWQWNEKRTYPVSAADPTRHAERKRLKDRSLSDHFVMRKGINTSCSKDRLRYCTMCYGGHCKSDRENVDVNLIPQLTTDCVIVFSKGSHFYHEDMWQSHFRQKDFIETLMQSEGSPWSSPDISRTRNVQLWMASEGCERQWWVIGLFNLL